MNNVNEAIVEQVVYEEEMQGIEQLIESLEIEALIKNGSEEVIDKICSDANSKSRNSATNEEKKVQHVNRRKRIKG